MWFSVLVFAQPSIDNDALFEDLVNRVDLDLLRVKTTTAARVALRDVDVSAVIVCPETSATVVTPLLDVTAQLRPRTPAIVLRNHGAEWLVAWKGRTFAVLRCPLPPLVLSRTLDVALGLGPLPR